MASELMRMGTKVFSPIAHTHPITKYGLPLGWDYWSQYDRWFIERCDNAIVLRLDGWEESKGVQAEIVMAKELNKSITYIDP